MTGRTAVVVTALVSLVALCLVMIALGQTVAAVLTLIPSIALAVQQILQAYTHHLEARHAAAGSRDGQEHSR
ncbi:MULTISPECIES: hypothetical protein [unclassified Streptomyces]|uniref:hypothetical protein n=1 Tax=unclassified Streptomyces TaxID=2593676 RepID=UPI00136BDD0D|nr:MULTISPECIES: hypothetical protein [unclassified Streptomyces]NEA02235.1 hypothetical protein [Streptomyces sp. SID10116]MYY80831.1 hypothetical protein [Streptomyces sp. SID335]MYZ13245.1 hypothetical protein [Streptomyces sp. SID337]NDZ88304.1 hypothetical protein [Streptomyces sp. SID10115]NEB49957.1 hypothetical protein [Streptomyces sp. SID339]